VARAGEGGCRVKKKVVLPVIDLGWKSSDERQSVSDKPAPCKENRGETLGLAKDPSSVKILILPRVRRLFAVHVLWLLGR